MRRAVTQLAMACVLWASPALAVSDPREMLPNRAEEVRAEAIGHLLRCLVCQNESVENSDSGLARDLRRIVRDRIATGASDKQVVGWMVARYGDFIRLRPPFDAKTLLLWLSPILALGIGCAIVLSSRRATVEPDVPLTCEERRRLAKLGLS